MRERRREGREGERRRGSSLEEGEQNTIVHDHSNEVYFTDLLPSGEGGFEHVSEGRNPGRHSGNAWP